MYHRIRTHLARTLVQVVLPVLARVLRALNLSALAPALALSPASHAGNCPQPPYPHRPLRLTARPRPHAIDAERRIRRTAMRLALDGLVVTACVRQAYSVGSLVAATTKAVA